MHWEAPEDSKQFIFTKEGYVVSKTWCGCCGHWVYTAWGPVIQDPGSPSRPNMLRTGLATAEEAKERCEAHHAAEGAEHG